MEAIPLYRRKKIVAAVENGESVTAVAKWFEISRDTVDRYRNLARAGELQPRPPAGGPEPKLDENGLQRLRQLVADTPDATLEASAEALANGKKADGKKADGEGRRSQLGPSGGRCRNRVLSRRRKVPRASEQDEEAVRQQRHEWVQFAATSDPAGLVFWTRPASQRI